MMFVTIAKTTVTEPKLLLVFQILHFFSGSLEALLQVRKFPLFSGNLEMKVKTGPMNQKSPPSKLSRLWIHKIKY